MTNGYIGAIQTSINKLHEEMMPKHEGMICDKVDLNGHFVPQDKSAKDNLKNMQESIQKDFNL